MSVIVMGLTLPVFLPYLLPCGFHSGLVLASTPLALALPLLEQFECRVVPLSAWTHAVRAWSGSAPLALIEGRFTPALASAVLSRGARVCLTTQGSRVTLPGWCHRRVQVAHSDCGRATTTTVSFVLFAQGLSLDGFSLPPPCPALMIQACLSDTIGSSVTRLRPTPLGLPAVSNLAVVGKPMYHSEGLFPAFPMRDLRVLTPLAFLPSGTWAARYLTPEEWGNVYDLPLSPPWSPAFRARLRHRLIPGKVVLTVLRSLCSFLHGGGSFFRFPSASLAPILRPSQYKTADLAQSPSPPLSQDKFQPPPYDSSVYWDKLENNTADFIDEAVEEYNQAVYNEWCAKLDGLADGQGITNVRVQVSSSPAAKQGQEKKQGAVDSGLPPAQHAGRRRRTTVTEAETVVEEDCSTSDQAKPGSTSQARSTLTNAAGAAEEERPSGNPLKAGLLEEVIGDVMEDQEARTAREQKATKADDAEVPVALWLERLAEDGPRSDAENVST